MIGEDELTDDLMMEAQVGCERGDSIFGNESSAFEEKYRRMVDATGKTGGNNVRKRLWDGTQVSSEDGQVLHGWENSTIITPDSCNVDVVFDPFPILF